MIRITVVPWVIDTLLAVLARDASEATTRNDVARKANSGAHVEVGALRILWFAMLTLRAGRDLETTWVADRGFSRVSGSDDCEDAGEKKNKMHV
jgi:hypothetical protein